MHNPEFVLGVVCMRQHQSSIQTGGSISILENWSSGRSRTLIHIHAFQHEAVFILQGAISAITAGKEHVIEAGESVFLPRGIPHQLVNESGTPAHYLLLCTPGGFEDFVEA